MRAQISDRQMGYFGVSERASKERGLGFWNAMNSWGWCGQSDHFGKTEVSRPSSI